VLVLVLVLVLLLVAVRVRVRDIPIATRPKSATPCRAEQA